MGATGARRPQRGRAAPFCGCFLWQLQNGGLEGTGFGPSLPGGGEAAAAFPTPTPTPTPFSFKPTRERQGRERGWCGLQLCPQAGRGLVRRRQAWVPEPSLPPPVLQRGWGGHLKMLSIDI